MLFPCCSLTSNVTSTAELTSEAYWSSELTQGRASGTNGSVYVVHFFLPASVEKKKTRVIPDHDVRGTLRASVTVTES